MLIWIFYSLLQSAVKLRIKWQYILTGKTVRSHVNDMFKNVSEIFFLTIPGNWWVGYLAIGFVILQYCWFTKGRTEQEYQSNLLIELLV